VVLGPVEAPPWYLQRRLPGSGLHKQGVPRLVRAMHKFFIRIRHYTVIANRSQLESP
jgi:hypothetical protein